MIVSVTNEVALDEDSIFAGGLGVLEADKFYAMARKNLDYIVLTPYYPKGYVKYDFVNSDPFAKEDVFPSTIDEKLSKIYEANVKLKKFSSEIGFFEYRINKARIVFVKILNPELSEKLFSRLYDHSHSVNMFYRYLLFSKACIEFLEKHLGFSNIDVIDLQESFFAFIPLLLEKENRPRIRLILHTPVPWGHPSFSRGLFHEEFNFEFIEHDVNLTSIAAAICDEIITVSKKHEEVSKNMLPHFRHKIRSVTNGIEIPRWMHAELYDRYRSGILDLKSLGEIKSNAKLTLIEHLNKYKRLDKDKMIIIWARRTVTYKRPYFIMNFIEENEDLNVNFVLAGKSDPRDGEGLSNMKRMKEFSDRYSNVVYVWSYEPKFAKLLFQGSDLNVFTPLSGWEACGTSMMKAGINGTPTISSRDGASLELIKDGYNGWFFGKELKELIYPGSQRAWEIDSEDYLDFKSKLLSIINLWESDRDRFLEISFNAINSFMPFVSCDRMLKEYYGDKAF
ncbi:MAG TPA: glycogen/starch/alpha-glucan phosphorylase [Geobacterales bacterium]|nr:glycogen/starch/alpha-glucan phosphorylase [Geobacterales bacterium]